MDRAGLERRFGPGYNQMMLNQYYTNVNTQVPPGLEQPIIEVDGTLRFSFPRIPLFPSLPDDTTDGREKNRRVEIWVRKQ